MIEILIGVIALIAIIVLLGFILPDKVHVERETVINAPREKVFEHISNFEKWDAWSPWAKLDPNAKYSFSGQGVGQKMVWESEDRNVGKGSQEIVVLEPTQKMVTHLAFEGMGVAKATFDLSDAGDGKTKVVWALDTNMREEMALHMKPMATYMGMFMMDGMLGKQYEEGLASLKQVAESG